ncbi:hypothetical protein L211DRAFT_847068 [Terfezia boudieri ATCC MYA-4762]|uniref:Uncharacterized protein n=1 Tax=Terfezia boudieri ATCC MYA-4762 TaxID=1051890 RepID=A0A3N4LXJ0_9PEZI|nr:hypothetical protein L211DRAFT_847068 [Terfezia boudieri ATCC MYA-4762]
MISRRNRRSLYGGARRLIKALVKIEELEKVNRRLREDMESLRNTPPSPPSNTQATPPTPPPPTTTNSVFTNTDPRPARSYAEAATMTSQTHKIPALPLQHPQNVEPPNSRRKEKGCTISEPSDGDIIQTYGSGTTALRRVRAMNNKPGRHHTPTSRVLAEKYEDLRKKYNQLQEERSMRSLYGGARRLIKALVKIEELEKVNRTLREDMESLRNTPPSPPSNDTSTQATPPTPPPPTTKISVSTNTDPRPARSYAEAATMTSQTHKIPAPPLQHPKNVEAPNSRGKGKRQGAGGTPEIHNSCTISEPSEGDIIQTYGSGTKGKGKEQQARATPHPHLPVLAEKYGDPRKKYNQLQEKYDEAHNYINQQEEYEEVYTEAHEGLIKALVKIEELEKTFQEHCDNANNVIMRRTGIRGYEKSEKNEKNANDEDNAVMTTTSPTTYNERAKAAENPPPHHQETCGGSTTPEKTQKDDINASTTTPDYSYPEPNTRRCISRGPNEVQTRSHVPLD